MSRLLAALFALAFLALAVWLAVACDALALLAFLAGWGAVHVADALAKL